MDSGNPPPWGCVENNMEKTREEKLNEIIAFCAGLEYNLHRRQKVNQAITVLHSEPHNGNHYFIEVYSRYRKGEDNDEWATIEICDEISNDSLDLVYRALGLESRALEAEIKEWATMYAICEKEWLEALSKVVAKHKEIDRLKAGIQKIIEFTDPIPNFGKAENKLGQSFRDFMVSLSNPEARETGATQPQ